MQVEIPRHVLEICWISRVTRHFLQCCGSYDLYRLPLGEAAGKHVGCQVDVIGLEGFDDSSDDVGVDERAVRIYAHEGQ